MDKITGTNACQNIIYWKYLIRNIHREQILDLKQAFHCSHTFPHLQPLHTQKGSRKPLGQNGRNAVQVKPRMCAASSLKIQRFFSEKRLIKSFQMKRKPRKIKIHGEHSQNTENDGDFTL